MEFNLNQVQFPLILICGIENTSVKRQPPKFMVLVCPSKDISAETIRHLSSLEGYLGNTIKDEPTKATSQRLD